MDKNSDKLYRHAQPAPERDQVRSEHAEWSQATFGNVGPVGPLKHLSKEALEAAAEPGDLSEWADMQFLLWDAQRRAGITDEQITQAMIEKLAVNKQREWPEPKDGEPRLHIKVQPAPVVPEEWTIADAVKFCKETGRQDAGAAMDAWNACRAAMLQAEPVTANKLGNSPAQSPIDHGYRKGCECSGCKTTVRICAELATKSPVIGIDPASGPDRTVEVSYVAPPGYVMVPKEPTGKQWAAGVLAFDSGMDKVTRIYKAMLAAAPHDTPALNSAQSVDTVLGKWISVSERMPENKPGSYEYLVFETLNNRVNHDYWNVPDKDGDAFTPFWNYYSGHVTHWMPLPAAPQEVGDA